MSPARHIPVVTASLLAPFAHALTRTGLDPVTALHRIGLDLPDLPEEASFVAAQTWYDFAGACAEIANDPCLGYRIGADAALDELPNLRVLDLPRATLGELLTALVIDVRRFSTIADYTLSTNGLIAGLQTSRTFVPNAPPAQIDGFFAGFMVRILRLCLGEEWAPGKLHIAVCDPTALPAETRTKCPVASAGLEGAGFSFPAQWLLHRTDGMRRQAALAGGNAASGFLESFRTMLDQHLDRQGLTLAEFARLTGQSPSSLKRRLREQGTSYQGELDNRRARRAVFLLQATGQSAADIGAEVGYPDPPGFSRAFRRWTGSAPAAFRRDRRLKRP